MTDFGPDETLTDSADIFWINKPVSVLAFVKKYGKNFQKNWTLKNILEF